MGVAHHSNYAVWFEVGRTDWIRKAGLSYGELENRGFLLPVVDLHCRFISPARYDDTLFIWTWVGEMRGPKITFCYEVCRADEGTLLARGETIHFWTDRNLKRFNLERKEPRLFRLLSERIFPAKRRNDLCFVC